METHYTYLIVETGTILFPLLFSFERKIQFYKKWKYIFPAIVLTAIPFIIWDHYYTDMGIWGFNQKYITGIMLFQLPVEEILFFFTIPYACFFIYLYLNYFYPKSGIFDRLVKIINLLAMIIMLILTIIFFKQLYTSVVCLLTLLILGFHTFLLKTDYMGKYWRFFMIMLIPFLLVNGILTGTALSESVFWYDKTTIMNFRLGTIPIEDLFYAFALMLMNISIYEWLETTAFYPNKYKTKLKKIPL